MSRSQVPAAAYRDQARGRLIFALDVASVAEAKEYVTQLVSEVGLFKVGKQLFLQAGPSIVRFIHRQGGRVFLDLKFHDIPRTVANAAVEAARLRVAMFNVHASGGLDMMRLTHQEVTKACHSANLPRPKILAVTVLTSLDQTDLKRLGMPGQIGHQVVRLATLAMQAGLDGVVASPLEITSLQRACGTNLLLVIPGIRPPGNSWDDQKRVLTPDEAMRRGADYIVVGKPIRDAKDPCIATRRIVRVMAQGLRSTATASVSSRPKNTRSGFLDRALGSR